MALHMSLYGRVMTGVCRVFVPGLDRDVDASLTRSDEALLPWCFCDTRKSSKSQQGRRETPCMYHLLMIPYRLNLQTSSCVKLDRCQPTPRSQTSKSSPTDFSGCRPILEKVAKPSKKRKRRGGSLGSFLVYITFLRLRWMSGVPC